MRVQVLRQFMNEGAIVIEGQIIGVSADRAKMMMNRPRPLISIPGVNQNASELIQFLAFVREIRALRYLEIGCRNGDTFYAAMRAIGEHGHGLAVDLPENDGTQARLRSTITELRLADIACDAIMGNSQDPAVISQVRDNSPFDLILIDADHRYDGVKADFDAYRGMAPVIALHDIDAPDGHMSDGYENGVGQFWREVKDGFRHREYITQGSMMGFGILFVGD